MAPYVPWKRDIAETAMCTDAVAFAAARSMIERDMRTVRDFELLASAGTSEPSERQLARTLARES